MNPHPFFLYLFPFSAHTLCSSFFKHTLHIFPSPRQRTQLAHTCCTLFFKKGLTFLFNPFALGTDIRKNLEYIRPLAPLAVFSFPAPENSVRTYHLILLLKRANGFMLSESTHLILSLSRARERAMHTPVALSYSRKD